MPGNFAFGFRLARTTAIRSGRIANTHGLLIRYHLASIGSLCLVQLFCQTLKVFARHCHIRLGQLDIFVDCAGLVGGIPQFVFDSQAASMVVVKQLQELGSYAEHVTISDLCWGLGGEPHSVNGMSKEVVHVVLWKQI